jgi:hypothetical protein
MSSAPSPEALSSRYEEDSYSSASRTFRARNERCDVFYAAPIDGSFSKAVMIYTGF